MDHLTDSIAVLRMLFQNFRRAAVAMLRVIGQSINPVFVSSG
jgi:hypothetical protein